MAKYQKKQLQDWWIGKARTATGYRRNIISNYPDGRGLTDIAIGKMIFFVYDAKHKKTLPFWDKFPMVFPIERYDNGFLGLNLHYLTPGERASLLGKLLEYSNNNKLNANTRLKLSYDLLNSMRSLDSLVKPCIKRYLYSHVRSLFIEIRANEWDRVIELPVDNFVKGGK